MNVDFPLKFDHRGQTAITGESDHIRDLIEQVLFTSPGERVNRLDFGCGLLQLIFEPNIDLLATATQLTVQGALQQWLGDLILVEAVTVDNEDAILQIRVQYLIRQSQQRQVSEFSRGGG